MILPLTEDKQTYDIYIHKQTNFPPENRIAKLILRSKDNYV